MTVRVWGIVCAVALLATAACTGTLSVAPQPGGLSVANGSASTSLPTAAATLAPTAPPSAARVPTPFVPPTPSSVCPPNCVPTPPPSPFGSPSPQPTAVLLPELIWSQSAIGGVGHSTLVFGFKTPPALWYGPVVYSYTSTVGSDPTVGPLQPIAAPPGLWSPGETFYRADVSGLYGDFGYDVGVAPLTKGACCARSSLTVIGQFWVSGVPSPTPSPLPPTAAPTTTAPTPTPYLTPGYPTPTPGFPTPPPPPPTPTDSPSPIACGPLPAPPTLVYPTDGATGVPIPGGSLTLRYLFYPTRWAWWDASVYGSPLPNVGGMYEVNPGAPSPPPGGAVPYTQTLSGLAAHTRYTVTFVPKSAFPTCAVPALALLFSFTTQ